MRTTRPGLPRDSSEYEKSKKETPIAVLLILIRFSSIDPFQQSPGIFPGFGFLSEKAPAQRAGPCFIPFVCSIQAGFRPHPEGTPPKARGISHGLKSVPRTLFAPVLPGPAFRFPHSRYEKSSCPKGRSFFHGDPYGNRTHVTAVKGRCLNRLTNGPGSGDLTRTGDRPGMNRVLYQLSYAAMCGQRISVPPKSAFLLYTGKPPLSRKK